MMDAKLSYDFECLSSNSSERAYLSLEIIIHTLYFIDKNLQHNIKERPSHVIPVILCEAKMSAGNIIDPHSSPNIPMKHYCNLFFKTQKSIFQQFGRFDCTLSCRISVCLVQWPCLNVPQYN